MNELAIVFAVGAAALLGGSAANAADYSPKAKASTDVTQQSTTSALSVGIIVTTDIAIIAGDTPITLRGVLTTLRRRTTPSLTVGMVMAARS